MKVKQLRNLMEEFCSLTGAIGACIASLEGLIISSFLPGDVDSRLVAAMAANLFGTSDRVAFELGVGKLRHAVVEAKGGSVIILYLDKVIFAVLASKDANLGLLTYKMEEFGKKILELLR
jgi:hypothetical protein